MKLAIIGDFRKENATHQATNAAIRHSVDQLRIGTAVDWVHTSTLPLAESYDGFLIAPGSPYANMEGVLEVIRHAREHGIPTLGTCGGFQHMVIEFARNVLGLVDAEHAENNPYASNLVVSALSCSLRGQTLEVRVFPGSIAYRLAGGALVENYYCNFGLNPSYKEAIDRAGFRVVGDDSTGEARILELDEHPFFMATLFVPQARSTAEAPHPLVTGFLRAALLTAPV